MSVVAHIGVTRLFGITLPSDGQAQDSQQTQTAELYKPIGANGEICTLKPHNTVKVDAVVNFLGARAHSQIAPGAGTVSTVVPLTSDHMEKVNEGGSGTLNASSFTSFTDATGSSTGAGAGGSDLGVLNLKSVNISLGEEARSKVAVKDVHKPQFDGSPGFRGQVTQENTGSVRYWGDLPSGIALGTQGCGFYGFTGGVFMCNQFVQGDKKDDANGGSYTFVHAPTATT